MAVTETPAPDADAGASDTTVHYRTCPLCEATCGLELTLRGDEVVRIRGDRDDPFSKGFICPKGSTLKHLHEDPDRLRRPMIRRGDDPDTATWEEVTWEEAFAEVERRLTPVLEADRQGVAIYLGNPNVHNLGGAIYNRPLIRALGTRNIFSASTVDQMPKHVSSGLMFGSAGSIPVPDLDRSDLVVLLGANPWESNGSLCTAPDFPGRLQAIQARGGRFVVVDPRRTKTAEHADQHLAIVPGTDALLLLALVHTLFDEDLVDLGTVADHVDGVDEVRQLVADLTPEAVAGAVGIDAGTIRALARDIAAAPTAAVYGRIGTHTAEFGTLASWAVDVVNVLTGNLDRPGGAMFPLAAQGKRPGPPAPGRGFTTGRHRSRVKGYPEVNSELPVATLADEILEPGEGQVRALITVAGNPVLSTPDSGRLAEALRGLDCMISVDIYRNETTRFAHVILPPPSPLERSHYDIAFTTLSVRNVAKWSPPVFETDAPQEGEILARLALIASGQGADADPALVDGLVLGALLGRATGEGGVCEGRDPDELADALWATTPTDRALEVMLRTGPYGDGFGADPDGLTLAGLADQPHGVDLGALAPRVPEVLSTRSGRIELAPEPIVADVPRLRAALDRHGDGLVLVGRRHLRSNNSWMHNLEVLVKGKPRCTLQVHPDDAERLGLAAGADARIRSRVGELVAPVEVTDEIRPGVVSLPHGWGHDQPGAALAVARRHAGVNTNVLTDADAIDPLSGNAVLNAIPVEVAPA
ncbi:MAG: molybdopterin oxidoreductase family protein [Acidimicrobiales bacterium]